LWGIARGFCDLQVAGFLEKRPRVHAVEPFARISRVLAGEDYRGTFAGSTAMTSIGGTTVTYQALSALKSCRGRAVVADEESARAAQRRLAQSGFYLELSSAAALTGVGKLVSQGAVASDAVVVLIGTSNGFSEYQEFLEPIARADGEAR
jgi:threonine synthase